MSGANPLFSQGIASIAIIRLGLVQFDVEFADPEIPLEMARLERGRC